MLIESIVGSLFVLAVFGAANTQLSICDPSQVLNIGPRQTFNRTLLTHAVMEATGLLSDAELLPLINRSNFLSVRPCVRFAESGTQAARRIIQNLGEGKCVSFPTVGIMGGLRSEYLQEYISNETLNYDKSVCTNDNTVVFVLPGATRRVQMERGMVVWTLLVIVLVLGGVCWWMMTMDESKPDDLDDDFTDLLFNCPEMQLADESILDDEPWEEGGLDY